MQVEGEVDLVQAGLGSAELADPPYTSSADPRPACTRSTSPSTCIFAYKLETFVALQPHPELIPEPDISKKKLVVLLREKFLRENHEGSSALGSWENHEVRTLRNIPYRLSLASHVRTHAA